MPGRAFLVIWAMRKMPYRISEKDREDVIKGLPIYQHPKKEIGLRGPLRTL